MGLFEVFATNNKAEIDGIEVRFGIKNSDGSEPIFRIARMGSTNKRWKKLLAKETEPYAHQIRTETLDPEVDEEITRKIFCTAILLGWRDLYVPQVFDIEGAVPYSVDNAIKLMQELPELYSMLREQATKLSNFRDSQIAEDSKN